MSDKNKVLSQLNHLFKVTQHRIISIDASKTSGEISSFLSLPAVSSMSSPNKKETLRSCLLKIMGKFGDMSETLYPDLFLCLKGSNSYALDEAFEELLNSEDGKAIDIKMPSPENSGPVMGSGGELAFAVKNESGRGVKPFVILDKDLNYMPEYSVDAFILDSGRKVQEIFNDCKENGRWGTLVYSPRLQDRIYVGKGNNTFLNTYNPPGWSKIQPGKVTLPKDVEKLINFMFPIPEEREYLLQWLNMSLTSRAPTCLILSGAPGTGKNTLKKFIKALHGATNSVELAKSVFSDKFNSQLSSCTFVFCDEGEINEKSTEIIKEVLNDTISIESKGVDATRGTHVHFSFMLANNKKRHTYLTFEDRKYAPLKMTDIRLDLPVSKGGLGEKFVRDFLADYSVDDAEILGKDINWEKVSLAANYIIKNHPPDFEKYPNLLYRGPMFYDICHAHLSWWQIEVLNMASAWSKHFCGKKKIEEFVTWGKFVEYFNGNSWKPPFDFKYFNDEYDKVKKPLPATVFDFLRVYFHDAESKGFIVEDDKFRIHPAGIDKFVARFESILKMKEEVKAMRQERAKELAGNEDDE